MWGLCRQSSRMGGRGAEGQLGGHNRKRVTFKFAPEGDTPEGKNQIM